MLRSLLLLFCAAAIFRQEKTCNCLDELHAVSNLIENSKRYNVQITRQGKEREFNAWKEQMVLEINRDGVSRFFCVGHIQKYVSFIRDRHNEVYFIPKDMASHVPTYPKPIEATPLRSDKVSGIYYAGSEKIVVMPENDTLWYGITLKSDAQAWTKGKIRLRLPKKKNGKFDIFEFYKNGLL